MTWVVYRVRRSPALLRLRPRTAGRWVGPAILCVSWASALRLKPSGAPILDWTKADPRVAA